MPVMSEPSSSTGIGETDIAGLVIGESSVAGMERPEDDRGYRSTLIA